MGWKKSMRVKEALMCQCLRAAHGRAAKSNTQIKKARLNRDGLLKKGSFPFGLKLIDPG